jgi:hypothetical protein
MEQQQPILQSIEQLRRTVDGLELVLKGDFNHPPPAHSPEEIAAVGLVLMEACRNEDFANVCLTRGIGPPTTRARFNRTSTPDSRDMSSLFWRTLNRRSQSQT